ncbi:hypothetical protein [Clostridium cagae]|uniref:hypothetical protein n=1 Tax=Clostridium cagae TaxID=2080751 RepID=UPI000CF7241A|nr:hypothetical protein [Clostridium cagae]
MRKIVDNIQNKTVNMANYIIEKRTETIERKMKEIVEFLKIDINNKELLKEYEHRIQHYGNMEKHILYKGKTELANFTMVLDDYGWRPSETKYILN